MGQPGPQMIAGAVEEHLRLVFHPAKRARMNDPRPVTLKFRTKRVAWLGIFSSARFVRFLRKRRERRALSRLHLLARSHVILNEAKNLTSLVPQRLQGQ